MNKINSKNTSTINTRERKAVIPKRDYADRRLIDTSDKKFQNSPGLQRRTAVENLKIAAQAYNEVGSMAELEQKIAATSATPMLISIYSHSHKAEYGFV